MCRRNDVKPVALISLWTLGGHYFRHENRLNSRLNGPIRTWCSNSADKRVRSQTLRGGVMAIARNLVQVDRNFCIPPLIDFCFFFWYLALQNFKDHFWYHGLVNGLKYLVCTILGRITAPETPPLLSGTASV